MNIYALSPDEQLAAMESSADGLSDAEVIKRQKKYGYNAIEKRRGKNYVREYLVQYVQFFAILLEVAAVLSLIANRYAPGEGYDILGFAIFGAVVVNATFAFWQEYRADKTVEALRKLIPSSITVRRNGENQKIKAVSLVPGDILILEEGDRIGADAVVISENSLYVNNATLNGESRPARRNTEPTEAESPLDAKNAVFAGTTVTSGNAIALVTTTGENTEFGKIASLAGNVRKRLTPMQKEIIRITRILTYAALFMGAVFLVLGYLSGKGLLMAAIFALALVVANVPEGMLPTITLSLSLASQNMAKRNALIKNLDSAQTLGSATVICTDKTGTLTRNEMTVREIYLTGGEEITVTGEGYSQEGDFEYSGGNDTSEERLEQFLNAGRLNCRARFSGEENFGDPTELAIVAAANKKMPATDDYEKTGEFPFTSDRKMMSSVYVHEGRNYLFSKGAFEILLPLSTHYMNSEGRAVPYDEASKREFLEKAESFEKRAYRVLAVAFREGEKEEKLTMLGLVAIMDLPREEVYEAIKKCRRAGIRVMMLTGDNPNTARAIAEKIGMHVDITLTGDELRRMPDDELRETLTSHCVLCARMRSEQKLRIATLLQTNGEVVAMTGDGVNDAPALRKADIGISMGIKGTEVAREASDMILLDDNFASIVAAIEEGRTVYFNIKKFVTYILSSNIPEIVPYILQFFLRIPLPLSVIQILTIDLGSDMLPGLALGSEKPEDDIMNRPPVGKDERILDAEVFKRGYFFLGAIEGTAAMVAFLGFLFLSGWQYGDLSITNSTLHYQAMTMTLLGAITCQLMNVWTLRSWENSAFSRGLFTNKLLIVAIIIEIIWIVMILTVPPVQYIFNTAYVPLPFLILLIPFPILLFVLHELYKWRIRTKREKNTPKKPGEDEAGCGEDIPNVC
ncbi:cation-translocating P-type ATPase [Methanoplanus limicola]|uniref:ATPase, P-type (Transporting), HAD superfamily, subfamily IC n=1 Tax=Methanoplanus limicola DSM 2279 TaxID=937775 RepID=H1YYE6_9EURY|nr:cation-transporting P-type ATPase [Methanoplanus limicola]EHQ35044.1 ATPase, P-type (transporting), HAD superfamily, subfamily IC [Methanoplanus limicola DSM 2279]